MKQRILVAIIGVPALIGVLCFSTGLGNGGAGGGAVRHRLP